MKSALVFLCVVACAYGAAVSVDESKANIISETNDQKPDGSFQYSLETSNGIISQVAGQVKSVGKDEVALTVQGSSQYQSPEGGVIQLSYVADENGFQPQGSHLPTPPPPQDIPEYILRSLEYIRTHPSKE